MDNEVFILEAAFSVWTNMGNHSLLACLFISSVKTGTRCIIRLDELSSFVHHSSRTTEANFSGQINHNNLFCARLYTRDELRDE